MLLVHGANPAAVDDFGRTAMHDACWRAEPCFEIVSLLLDADPSLLHRADVRGSTALQYVPPEHWLRWGSWLLHSAYPRIQQIPLQQQPVV